MMHSKNRSPFARRSRLFQAIACGLLVGGIAAPAVAQSVIDAPMASASACSRLDVDHAQACQDSQAARLRFSLERRQPQATSSVNAAATAPISTAAINGEPGNPESWVTEEFQQDWGLGAINAQYAYARGLTGKDMILGVMDSGVGFHHTEFAGKQNVSVTMADVLADGSRCTNFNSFSTPSGCFATHGDDVGIDYVGFNANVPQNIRNIISDPNLNYIKPGFAYQSHGTHVAGTIAANRDGRGMHGVAFGANIASARRFYDTIREWARTSNGYAVVNIAASPSPGLSANREAFLDMAAAGVRAVNHSWGYTIPIYTGADLDDYYDFAGNAPLWDTFRDGSLNTGMLQVWSAGNITVPPPPGTRPMSGLTASLPRYAPELEPYWLSVVNLARTGNAANPYTISGGSMICGDAKNWCISAPGTQIYSSVFGGENNIVGAPHRNPDGSYSLEITSESPTSSYALYTGTSMAAPHVTGALALLFQRYPYLTNPQVRDILLTTATDMGAPGVDEIYGWGMLNLRKAIEGYGQFRVDTDVVMNQQAGGVHVWNDARVWDDWTNDIGGPGRLSFDSQAGGWLRLSGTNTFAGITLKGGTLELTGANALTGDVQLDGGVFRLDSSLDGSALTVNEGARAAINGTVSNGATLVNAGGMLMGTGTLGDTTIYGAIAPGNSIGTLTVNGNYVQQAGSRFFVEMQPPSATDKVMVNGTATLNGGTVVALRQPGVFGLGQSYNFLTATGGVNGKFAGVDNSALGIFLKMALRYDANNAYADVIRAASLASVATTWNQSQTAHALDGLPDSNALLQALVLLPTAAQANAAFDQLSGEVHPSTRAVLADDSRHLRNAALSRARTGQDAFTGQSAGPGFALWADVLSNGGSLDGNANAASARYSGYQMLVGGDYQFDGGWRIGVFGGSARGDVDVGMRGSKAEIRSRMVGVYGGQRWGGFGVQAGYTHAWHDLDSERKVAFAGFSDGLTARYDASTDQAFIEGGYLFGGTAWQVEPYLQYANVRVKSDGFGERGGLAALTSDSATSKLDYATGGIRANLNLKGSQQEQTWLSLRGGLAYRQANGDATSANTLRFAGSNAFNVHGAPIAKKATIAELGVAARLSERTLLEVGYSGQFADEGNDHGANARISVRF